MNKRQKSRIGYLHVTALTVAALVCANVDVHITPGVVSVLIAVGLKEKDPPSRRSWPGSSLILPPTPSTRAFC
jgi:hypothetical protein